MGEGVDYLLSPPAIFSQKTKQKLTNLKDLHYERYKQ